MSERPILFSGPMVRAILAGTKTQTRRLIRPQPDQKWGSGIAFPRNGLGVRSDAFHVHARVAGEDRYIYCPYGVPGDRLWVRETWSAPTRREGGYDSAGVLYRADQLWDGMSRGDFGWDWKPSIHMPRWASRISLEVTEVRVQRLQEISADDVVDEGIDPSTVPGIGSDASFVAAFERLWDSINGKRAPWDSNPWVWVVGFEREEEKA